MELKHPEGFFHISILLMTEFFSYYGTRGLLVLFLTQYLTFSDTHAYTLFGAYTSLVWVTPIIGGYLADRFLGYHFCVIVGVLLIFLGNLCFAFSGMHIALIYLAMTLIICGYGFFKGNVSCLAGELYSKDDRRRDTDFSWYYISGNVGAFLAFIICGWTYTAIGWYASFLFSAFAMLIGLIIFIAGKKHFSNTRQINTRALAEKRFFLPVNTWIISGCAASFILFMLLLTYHATGYLLLIIGLISLSIISSLFIRASRYERHQLILIYCFMLFGFVFWVFDQQNGSSVILFIQRHVKHTIFHIEIPTASFQTINALSVMLGGFIMSWVWKKLQQANIIIPSLIKLCLGTLMLTSGFFFIAMTAKLATLSLDNTAPMGTIIIGLALIGLGELFVDPIALANITRLNPLNSSGVLIGIYLLATGSFSNYVAGELATLTDVDRYARGVSHISSSIIYFDVFKYISWTGTGITVLLLVIGFSLHRLLKIKA